MPRRWLCSLILLVSIGCVSTSQIQPSNLRASSEIEWVIVRTQASDEVEITDPMVENDSLVGYQMREGRRGPRVAIPLADVSSVSHKHFDAPKTLLWGAAVGAAFLATWAYVNAGL